MEAEERARPAPATLHRAGTLVARRVRALPRAAREERRPVLAAVLRVQRAEERVRVEPPACPLGEALQAPGALALQPPFMRVEMLECRAECLRLERPHGRIVDERGFARGAQL